MNTYTKIGINVLAWLSMSVAALASESVTIKVGHVLSPSHSWHVATKNVAAEVLEVTDGRVRLELFHSGQLGDEKEMIEAIQFGAIGGGVIGSGSFQSIEPVFGVTNLPYAWPTREQAYADFDGALGNRLAQILDKQGFIALGWYEGGYRHVTNNVGPVKTPHDLRGIKIRVTPDKMRLNTFTAMGAEPAPLAFGELYSALQQGLFDGQENPVEIVRSGSFFEVQKYLSLTAHVWSSAVIVLSTDVWEKISPEDQAAIREVVLKWQDQQRTAMNDAETSVLEDLKAKGMAVNEIDDPKPFVDAVKPVWEDFETEFGSDIVDLIGAGK